MYIIVRRWFKRRKQVFRKSTINSPSFLLVGGRGTVTNYCRNCTYLPGRVTSPYNEFNILFWSILMVLSLKKIIFITFSSLGVNR